jgi:hypothetical protein
MFWRSGHRNVKGDLGQHGLSKWWLSTFDEQERSYIEATHHGLGGSGIESSLTKGEARPTSQSTAQFLAVLSQWFQSPHDRSIALRILDKAEASAENPLELHFVYLRRIQVAYDGLDSSPQVLDETISACQKQIAIAKSAAKAFQKDPAFKKSPLPTHTGYQRLFLIREKQGDFAEAIALAKDARKQGWEGRDPDIWTKQIERCERRM